MILRLSHMVRSLPQIELWIKLRQPEFAFQCFEFEADDNFHWKEYTRHSILCKRISDIFLKMNDFGLGAYRFLRVPIVMGWEAFLADWGKLPFRLIVRFPSLIGLIRERYQQCQAGLFDMKFFGIYQQTGDSLLGQTRQNSHPTMQLNKKIRQFTRFAGQGFSKPTLLKFKSWRHLKLRLSSVLQCCCSRIQGSSRKYAWKAWQKSLNDDLGGGFTYFLFFLPKIVKWSNLTCAYFSNWVGSTTT